MFEGGFLDRGRRMLMGRGGGLGRLVGGVDLSFEVCQMLKVEV